MSGISSRHGTIAIAKQTAKGSAAATPTVKFALSAAPSVAPIKERGRYVMTDQGRDPGQAYTSRMAVGGDFQVYMHPDGFGLLGLGVLGTNADTGAGPNYTHTITPADDVPWFTVWRMVGKVIFERFVDCKINTLRVEGNAGSPLVVSIGLEGIKAEFEAADTALAKLTSAGYLYPEANGRILLAAVAKRIHRVTIDIGNGLSSYQADDYHPSDIDPGGREVGLSFATRFASGAIGVNEYRTYYYGSNAGTQQSGAVATQAFSVEFYRDANTSVKFDFPQVAFAAVPVNPDPGGDPLEVEVATVVEKPTGATPIVTLVVKDQTATW